MHEQPDIHARLMARYPQVCNSESHDFTLFIYPGDVVPEAATVVAGTVQLGVQAWMFTNIPY